MGQPQQIVSTPQGTSDPPQPNMISSTAADPLWRAVRRGVAPAFAAPNIRAAFPAVVALTGRLAARLREHGAARPLDLDGALMCHALDVIGQVVPLLQWTTSGGLGGLGFFWVFKTLDPLEPGWRAHVPRAGRHRPGSNHC